MSNPLLTPMAFAATAMVTAQAGQWPDVTRYEINSQRSVNDGGQVWILALFANTTLRWRKIFTPEELDSLRGLMVSEIAGWLIERMPEIFTPRANPVLDLQARIIENLKEAVRLHDESGIMLAAAQVNLAQLKELTANG